MARNGKNGHHPRQPPAPKPPVPARPGFRAVKARSYQSADLHVSVRVTEEAGRGFRVELDGGIVDTQAGGEAMGGLLVRLLCGPDGNARRLDDRREVALLCDVLQCWELLDRRELRGMVNRARRVLAEADGIDMNGVLTGDTLEDDT